MKILRIGGRNLASLAGEFEVDFQREPLLSAGLFAISGPTGAGKSTLLDALCLALYDATPRLARASSKGIGLPDVRDEVVTPQDSRTLLRRGAADGYAEVDFVGTDDCSYRARWSVRRAYGKADGALQGVSMTLKRLPDLQAFGGTNREVKSEIEQRIGLSFDQFTRAVLLAQNEFFAFLKADDGERGELLETLTGTAVYSVISRRAFERAKAELSALQQLNEQLAQHKPLDQEARGQLEAGSLRAAQDVASLNQRRNMLDEHLRWHQALELALRGEQQALQEVDRLEAARQTAAPRRDHFVRVESVQAARALQGDCDRAAADAARSQTAIADCEAAAANADRARQQADAARDTASRALQVAEQAQKAAAPLLDRAKGLDAQIDTVRPAHRKAGQSLAEAQGAEARALQALRHNEDQRAHARQELQTAVDWLAQHAQLQPLADSWPRWDVLFAQAATAARDHASLTQAHAAGREEGVRLQQLAAQAQSLLATAGQALATAETRRSDCVARLAAFDISALLERKARADAQRDALSAASGLWRSLDSHLRLRSELEGKSTQLQDALVRAESALADANARIPMAEAAQTQAERSLRIAEAACGERVETLRAALEPDTPCPVCGSTGHPYSVDHPQRAMLAALKQEVLECRTQLQHLLQQRATQTTLAAEQRRQLDAAARQRDALTATIESATQAWNAHPVAAETDGIEAGMRTGWFADQDQSLRAQLQAVGLEERAARAAGQAKEVAQQEYENAGRQQQTARDAATTAQSALAQAQSNCDAVAEKCAAAGLRLEATLADLDVAFGGRDWRGGWHAAPGDFHAQCRMDVEQWHAQRQARDDRQIGIGQLEVARASLAEALTRAGDDLRRATESFAAGTAALADMQAARDSLFGGKPVSQAEAELGAAVETAKAQLTARTQAAQQCETDHARCAETVLQARQRLTLELVAAQTAATRLDAWIDEADAGRAADAAPLDREHLRTLLAYPADWIAGERAQLQAIDSALQDARTVLQERRAQRVVHEERRPSAETAETVRAELEQVAEQWQSASRQAVALQVDIAQDDARRQQAASMMTKIEQQEAMTRMWAQLGELIGSADGKKFRNYAQQFTLDVLLGYANRHLEDLARRYRLERIRDTLALMVVDRDMGDEMRSVHSLSGGESFLVSLALALGLASLSSNRVRVESLFIDEGFGSLDADTLSLAMDALDGLQSMGRRVGVISHVQEMTERISTRILVRRTAGGKSAVEIGR